MSAIAVPAALLMVLAGHAYALAQRLNVGVVAGVAAFAVTALVWGVVPGALLLFVVSAIAFLRLRPEAAPLFWLGFASDAFAFLAQQAPTGGGIWASLVLLLLLALAGGALTRLARRRSQDRLYRAAH